MPSKDRGILCSLLLFLGVLCFSFSSAEACYAQDKSDDVKMLLKERRDLLNEAATQMAKIYIALRNITLQEVVQAERDALKADLDWFDKPEDRVQAIERHKKAADNLLEAAKVKVRGGIEPRYTVSLARAYVLEVQIELIKEKDKQKQKPKPGK